MKKKERASVSKKGSIEMNENKSRKKKKEQVWPKKRSIEMNEKKERKRKERSWPKE